LARALDLQHGQIEPPHSVDLLGPGIGKADPAGVVAEAVRLEDAIEARAGGEIGRAEADHIRDGKCEFRLGEPVVRPDILQDVVERTEFLLPIPHRPASTVEMAAGGRGNRVAAAVKSVRLSDAFATLLGGAAEAEGEIAPPLMRTLIDVPAAVGDEIAAADEEGEVKSVAVP